MSDLSQNETLKLHRKILWARDYWRRAVLRKDMHAARRAAVLEDVAETRLEQRRPMRVRASVSLATPATA